MDKNLPIIEFNKNNKITNIPPIINNINKSLNGIMSSMARNDKMTSNNIYAIINNNYYNDRYNTHNDNYSEYSKIADNIKSITDDVRRIADNQESYFTFKKNRLLESDFEKTNTKDKTDTDGGNEKIKKSTDSTIDMLSILGLAIGGLAAGIKHAFNIWKFYAGSLFKGIGNVGKGIFKFSSYIGNLIKNSKLFNTILSKIPVPLKNAVSSVSKHLTRFTNSLKSIPSKIKNIFNSVKNVCGSAMTWVSKFGKSTMDAIKNSKIGKMVGDTANKVKNSKVGGFLSRAWEGTKSLAKSGYGYVKSKGGKAISMATNAVKNSSFGKAVASGYKAASKATGVVAKAAGKFSKAIPVVGQAIALGMTLWDTIDNYDAIKTVFPKTSFIGGTAESVLSAAANQLSFGLYDPMTMTKKVAAAIIARRNNNPNLELENEILQEGGRELLETGFANNNIDINATIKEVESKSEKSRGVTLSSGEVFKNKLNNNKTVTPTEPISKSENLSLNALNEANGILKVNSSISQIPSNNFNNFSNESRNFEDSKTRNEMLKLFKKYLKMFKRNFRHLFKLLGDDVVEESTVKKSSRQDTSITPQNSFSNYPTNSTSSNTYNNVSTYTEKPNGVSYNNTLPTESLSGSSYVPNKNVSNPYAGTDKHEGWLSELGETGKIGGDTATISTGAGDFGGASYGKHQFASNNGVVQNFIKGSGFANEFAGLRPGTQAFNDKWKQLSSNKDFQAAEDRFYKQQYVNPIVNNLKKQGMDIENDPIMKEMAISSSVQFGSAGANRLFQNAFAGKDYNKMTAEERVKALTDYKTSDAFIARNFKSSSKGTQLSVQKRFAREGDLMLKEIESQKNKKISDVTQPTEDLKGNVKDNIVTPTTTKAYRMTQEQYNEIMNRKASGEKLPDIYEDMGFAVNSNLESIEKQDYKTTAEIEKRYNIPEKYSFGGIATGIDGRMITPISDTEKQNKVDAINTNSRQQPQIIPTPVQQPVQQPVRQQQPHMQSKIPDGTYSGFNTGMVNWM